MTALPAPFRAAYAPSDEAMARTLLASATLSPDREARIDAEATTLIDAIRAKTGGFGGVEELLRE